MGSQWIRLEQILKIGIMKDKLKKLLIEYGIYPEVVDKFIDEILEVINE